MFLLYGAYALAFWYGFWLYSLGEVEQSGKVITTLFSIMIGLNSFSQPAGYISASLAVAASVKELFAIIDLAPAESKEDEVSDGPAKLGDNVTFDDVAFEYPSRPGAHVIKGINMTLPIGKRLSAPVAAVRAFASASCSAGTASVQARFDSAGEICAIGTSVG